jgi:hypothetical protein
MKEICCKSCFQPQLLEYFKQGELLHGDSLYIVHNKSYGDIAVLTCQ